MTELLGRRQLLAGVGGAGALGTLALVGAGRADATQLSTATNAEAVAAVKAASSRKTVSKGSSGADVKYLQQRLNAVGYWCGTPDSEFGALTQQAVYALQKAWSLSRDGIVGAKTWAKVASNTRRPAKYGSGHRIEIDKKRQLLLVVFGSQVKYTFNTSTGSGERFYAWGKWYTATTPSGKYTISRYRSGWVTNELGSLYRPYFFNGGIAIHGATSIPTYAASHGCCRLSVSAQNKLIAEKHIAVGRQVRVY